MRWKRARSGRQDQLIYRQGFSKAVSLVGLPLLVGSIVGFFFIVNRARAEGLFAGPPPHAPGAGEGIVVGWGLFLGVLLVLLIFLALGLRLSHGQELVIDASRRVVVRGWHFLFLQSNRPQELTLYKAVTWRESTILGSEGESRISYPVYLMSSSTDPLILLPMRSGEEALKEGQAISDLLGIPLERPDPTPRAASWEDHPAVRIFRALSGKGRRWRADAIPPDRLVVSMGHTFFTKLWGLFAALIGLIGIFASLSGEKMANVPGGSPVIGFLITSVLLLLGVYLMFGRRGVTFDRSLHQVTFWRGAIRPLRSRPHHAGPYTTVTQTRTSSQRSILPIYPLSLTGERNEHLHLLACFTLQESTELGQRIAEVLNLTFHGITDNDAPAHD